MATRAATGSANHPNPRRAAAEAVQAARQAVGAGRSQIAIVYATVGYEQAPLVRAVANELGDVPFIGCSVEGTIGSEGSNEDGFSLQVCLIASDELRFATAHATGLGEDSEAAGRRLGAQLKDHIGDDTLGLITLADGLSLNFDRFIVGWQGGAGHDRFLPVIGGTAGDDWEFKKTYQYVNGEVLNDAVTAVLVSGEGRLAHAVSHGCMPTSRKHTITSADKNVIKEIDGRPALDVLNDYLEISEKENWQKAIVNLALGFRAPSEISDEYDEHVIRYIPVKNEEEGYLQINTEVEAGQAVWMTRRDYEKMEAGLDKTLATLREQMGDAKPKLVLQFDCAGRGKVILPQVKKDELIAKLVEGLGGDPAWSGFHSYGELGPVNGRNYFHNFTAVIAALY